MKKKTYCFDLDGVICKTSQNNYASSKPISKAVKKVNSLYFKGHKVIIFTARFMGRSKERVTLAKKRGYQLTKNQLSKWGLKYHKLILGKPSYDVIVDDKSYNYNTSWYKKLK